MTLYFSSKNIPALQELTMQQRRETMQKAENKFTAPEKILLNLIKLSILVPMFLYMVWLDGWQLILPPVFAVIGYFFVYRVIILALINKKLAKALSQTK
ncbi:MAG: hypothetical protein JKX78_12255 [Alteromonadaceae bacterium]|nr:hypothetical protein [Alteromonadaceae bacterium]